ncbi:NfeD family protein [Paenibacillus sp. CAU 1782]
MNKRSIRVLRMALPLLLAAVLLLSFVSVIGASQAEETEGANSSTGPAVYVIPVKEKVDQGLQAFLERAYKEADEARAEHIILVLNTLGGRVDSASEIGELIRTSPIPSTAFIQGKAVSAGTYIALNADNIVMQKGSSMGSAAVVNGAGDLIDDPKTVSFWVSQMSEAAKLNGRDPAIAAAMVDVNAVISLPEIGVEKGKGDILSLSASEAEQVGYSEGTANSVEEVVAWLKLEGRTQIHVEPSIAEQVAKFLVNPIVATVLLILGIAGVAIELFVPGFGAPGIVGLLSFALFFFGSYISGLAGLETVVLFVLGILLLALELFIPSFGILGILGGGALITGIILAAPTPQSGFLTLGVAFAVSVVIVVLFARTNKGRGIWNKFILRESLTTEEGYLSADVKTSLIGLEGTTLTPLRPAGTALIGDSRVDVVTGGEFIPAKSRVKVVKAEGTWVVVKEIGRED